MTLLGQEWQVVVEGNFELFGMELQLIAIDQAGIMI